MRFKVLLTVVLLSLVSGHTAYGSNLKPDALSFYNQGLALQKEGRVSSAISKYQQSIKLDPTNAEFFYALGTCYQQMNRPDDALKNYRKAQSIKPKDLRYGVAIQGLANVFYNQGIKEQEEKKYAQALNLYQLALELNRTDADFHYALGSCFQAMNKMSEAVMHYKQAAFISPAEPKFKDAIEQIASNETYSRAYSSQQNRNYDQALILYREAIKSNPGEAKYYYALGTCLQAMNRLEEAQDNYSKAVSLDEHEPQYALAIKSVKVAPILQKGIESYNKLDFAAAIACFKSALEINDEPVIHYNLGLALMADGQIEQAKIEFQKAGVTEPKIRPDSIPENIS